MNRRRNGSSAAKNATAAACRALHRRQRTSSGETAADTPGSAEQCRNCGRPLTLEMDRERERKRGWREEEGVGEKSRAAGEQ